MSAPNTSDIRSWAKQQGLTVSERGRLSQDVVSAYAKAGRKAAPAKAQKPAKAPARKASTNASRVATTKTVPTAKLADVQVTATPVPVDTALEQRVAELEKQVLSLTQRLDAAVTALTKRGRAFTLPKRK